MLTGLPKAYAKEPGKSLAALGWDVQWFTNSLDLGTREVSTLLPSPSFLASAGFTKGSVSCIAFWDIIISHACDWLFKNLTMISLG